MKLDDKKVLASNLILIHGTDPLQRINGMKSVLKTLGIEDGDLDLESVNADQKPPIEWLGSASQFPFMGENRVVIVRNLCRLEPKATWESPKKGKFDKSHPFIVEVSKLQSHSRLLLVADDETGETAEKRYARALPDWIKLTQASGGYVLDTTETVRDIAAFTKQEAQNLGKSISTGAVRSLIEMLNGNPAEIRSELQKLALYIGEAAEIRESDVLNVTTPDPQYNVFKLVDAIVAGQTSQALQMTKTVFAQSSKIESEIFPSVFPMLARQFRFLWQGRLIVESGETLGQLSQQTFESFPTSSNLMKNQDWINRKVITSARSTTFGKLSECFSILTDADAKIKGQRFASHASETVEQMVLKLCQVFARA